MPQFSLKLRPRVGTMAKKIQYLQLSSAVLFTFGTVAIAQAAQSAVLDDVFDNIFGRGPNPYRQCAERLARRGVTPNEAATACAAATRPEDLGECVQRMGRVNVSAADAVNTCVRVRRPVEAANCVVDISRQAASTAFADVLAGCRSSLLPERFSDCVIGLNRELRGITTQAAINQCLSASDYARDVLPTFVPGAGQSPINLPLTLPGSSTTPTTPQTIPTIPQTTPTTPQTTPTTPSGTGLPQRF